jgi:hypothetical protein
VVAKRKHYARADTCWKQAIVGRKLGALVVHWLFQGILYMDPTERCFKLALDVVLAFAATLVLKLLLPSWMALGLGIISAHTANFFFNGQVYGVLKHFGGVRHTWPEFSCEVERLRERVVREPCVRYAAVYGSLARDAWCPESDLDVRLVRAPGVRNGCRACWFALCERARAFCRRFPLDLYVLDRNESLDRMSEKRAAIIFKAPADRFSGRGDDSHVK